MIRLLKGHVMDCLAKLPDNSIHMCVTSPPFWHVRSFGIPGQIWGGDRDCEHEFILHEIAAETHTLAYRPEDRVIDQQGPCIKCDAWFGSLGLENHPMEFVEHLRMVFTEVKRVLRPDGTLWLHLGDKRIAQEKLPDLKPKDLAGVPWKTAYYLQSMGYYLRSVVILDKKAPIPEVKKGRPITSYEYLFMLTKGSDCYYDDYGVDDGNVKDVWQIGHDYSSTGNHFGVFPKILPERCIKLSTSPIGVCPSCGAQYKRVFTTHKVQNTNTHKRLPKTKTIPTKEWMPSCKCAAGTPIPATIIDPFAGTGTSLLIAELLRRDSIGIELSDEHVQTTKQRISREAGLFSKIVEG